MHPGIGSALTQPWLGAIIRRMYIIIAALIAVIFALASAVVVLWRRTRRVSLGLDEITEDTLKALYYLSRQQPFVRSRDLIRAADLQPGRYALIASELRRRGWAQPEADALRISPAGTGARWS